MHKISVITREVIGLAEGSGGYDPFIITEEDYKKTKKLNLFKIQTETESPGLKTPLSKIKKDIFDDIDPSLVIESPLLIKRNTINRQKSLRSKLLKGIAEKEIQNYSSKEITSEETEMTELNMKGNFSDTLSDDEKKYEYINN